jgi:hypothetical protein
MVGIWARYWSYVSNDWIGVGSSASWIGVRFGGRGAI